MNEQQRSDRLANLMGRHPVSWSKVGGGYTPAGRWIVEFNDGSTAFAKIGTTPNTSEWLRVEHRMYSQIDAPWLPEFLGWDDDGDAPILVSEDLSRAHWPPPWKPGNVDAVLRALDEISRTTPPEGTPVIDTVRMSGRFDVEKNPAEFLSLRLCTSEWLEESLPPAC
jgi:hypothetical protein